MIEFASKEIDNDITDCHFNYLVTRVTSTSGGGISRAYYGATWSCLQVAETLLK